MRQTEAALLGVERLLPSHSLKFTPPLTLQLWGAWWATTLFWTYLSSAANRRPFISRPWHKLPWGPKSLQALPLEPILKVALPLMGILGELWLGHEQYMALYAPDGKFNTGNINDWQHSMMYFSFVASGVVDLLSASAGLPATLSRAFLGLSFLVEGTLLVFHLKGPAIEVMVHLLLCLQIFATVLSVAAETLQPQSLVAAALRPLFTMAQGAWWVQTAYIMYRANPAWDPDYMGAEMMAPVLFCFHLVLIALAMLLLLLGLRAVMERQRGVAIALTQPDGSPPGAYQAVADANHLELAALGDKTRF